MLSAVLCCCAVLCVVLSAVLSAVLCCALLCSDVLCCALRSAQCCAVLSVQCCAVLCWSLLSVFSSGKLTSHLIDRMVAGQLVALLVVGVLVTAGSG